jgi:integrase
MGIKKIYYNEFECYRESTPKQKQEYKNRYYEIPELPEKMQEELESFLIGRSGTVSIVTMNHDKSYYNNILRFLETQRTVKCNSFLDQTEDTWIRKFKGWMLQEQIPLTYEKKSVYGTTSIIASKPLQYFKGLLTHVQPKDNRDEKDKDIWQLDKLEIEIRGNPIYNVQTLNFTKIFQLDIREEVKKAIYLLLQYEKISTVQSKMTAIRNFSKFLSEKYPKLESCSEIDRDILENYLVHCMATGFANRSRSTIIGALRILLETVGKIYNYPQLEKLFLDTDIPPEIEPEFKVYSDHEMKVLNAHITKMDEQIARCLVIHQMLGTRISDTLTLRPDCVYDMDGQKMIRIHQVKTGTYEKPISVDLALLIQKAADYTKEKYGETKYIFVNKNNHERPLQYNTIQQKVLMMIRDENLLDDSGKRFSFNSHLYRHYYGVKLTELHIDDWTLAKLLGHTRLSSVQHYRKMSNQLMADETRAVRAMMSKIIYENLDGWGEEYEQIRQDDFHE